MQDDPPGNLALWEEYVCGANEQGCIANFDEYDENDPWNAGCFPCVTNSENNMNGIWCPEPGTTFPFPAAGYYMERHAAPSTTVTCQPPEACTGDFGLQGCFEGYEESRCARCKLMYYRSGDQCLQCPGSWPLGLIAVAVVVGLLAIGLLLIALILLIFITPVLKLIIFLIFYVLLLWKF